MNKFKVTGMSCAACSARVDKAVRGVKGVEGCTVNLLTGDLTVIGDVSAKEIENAVINAGYGIASETQQSEKAKSDFSLLKRRLISSVIILLFLMYISMFHHMFSAPLPKFLAHNSFLSGVLQFLLSGAIIIINRKFFINGTKGVINKAPNMDTLVALGSGVSFVYSSVLLFASLGGSLYFESAAMILTLVTVGKMLEGRAKDKTADAVNALKSLAPERATVIENETEKIIPIENLKVGDVFVVRPGECVPADAVVINGSSAVDESALTGESIPIDKTVGDTVIGATLNKNGVLYCKTERVGKETTFSSIIETVLNTASGKAPVARLADKVAGVFVPIVLAIAFVCFCVWMLCGRSLDFSLSRAISVLVISCPCALGLATPVAIMVGSGVGAKYGVLFKNAAALETAGKVKIVIFDKTGTVTTGVPQVTDVFSDDTENLLLYAASLESPSSHPLSNAVCEYAEKNGVKPLETKDFSEISGSGVKAIINGKDCFAGNLKSAAEKALIDDKTTKFAENAAIQGKTPIVFVAQNSVIGVIAVADAVKTDSKKAVSELKKMGIEVVMLSGDNEKTALKIASDVEIETVIAGVSPEKKAQIVSEYMKKGITAMVGDGINDAVALTAADIGISMGGGRDVAVKSADVVIMNNSLMSVVTALKLGKKTLINIKENLFWAFIYNVIGIPIAAGALIPLFGITLSPMFGAAAMSISSFCVVSNALRLNFFKIKKEKKIMKKIVIEGMMCPHCEAHVKNALLGIKEVSEAAVSHEKGTAEVTLSAEVDNGILKAAVEAAGYKVIGIE